MQAGAAGRNQYAMVRWPAKQDCANCPMIAPFGRHQIAFRGKIDYVSGDTATRVLRSDEELAFTPFDMEGGKSRLARWEAQFTKTLVAGGFIFLVAYAIPIILDGLHPEVRAFCDAVITVLWAAFAIDFVVRLVLATDKGHFLKHNIFDLITLGVPMLRPLRALTVMQRFSEWASSSLRGKWLTYVISAAVLAILVGSLAVVDAERGHLDATITTWPIGLIWAFEAVTDVGYDEYDPVTAEGHIVGLVLMLGGVVLMGFVIAAISSWFIENLSEQLHDKKAPATVGQVEDLTKIDKEILEAIRRVPKNSLEQLPYSSGVEQSGATNALLAP